MENYDQIYEPEKGSVLTGTVGAIIGALLGMIVWVVVLMMGYVASIVGILIAWLSGKGYDLLHGRQGTIKTVIVILCVVLAVVGGTVASDVIDSFQQYNEALDDFNVLEARMFQNQFPTPMDFAVYYLQDAENQSVIVKNCAMGLLFGLLGAVGFMFDSRRKAQGASASASVAAPTNVTENASPDVLAASESAEDSDKPVTPAE